MGFRYTVCRIAAGFDVTGYVKNLSDGRVELVAEGEPGELDRLVRGIETAMSEYIRDISTNESPSVGAYKDFGIEY